MCKLCNLQAISTQTTGWSLAKLFNLRCCSSRLVEAAQGEKCQSQDSMRTPLAALASSKQLLQLVCSFCHPLFLRCFWRAIKYQCRLTLAHFTPGHLSHGRLLISHSADFKVSIHTHTHRCCKRAGTWSFWPLSYQSVALKWLDCEITFTWACLFFRCEHGLVNRHLGLYVLNSALG